jgi:hypothetical protein
MSIQLNLSEAFHNKENLTGNKSSFGFSFNPATVEPKELVKHIRIGKAFTVGYFSDNRRVESHFVSSQLLALDLDDCPMDMDQLEASSEFIQEYAFMMYPTPSSTAEQPKTRILFMLDEPETSASRWRILQLALMEHFSEVRPDEACKDPARLFYGCETSNYYINYPARLPIALVGGLAQPLAERDDFSLIAERYTVTYHRTDTDLERCAVNFLNHGLKKISQAGQGSKHKTFVNYAMWLYGLNAGGWPISKSDIERGLTSIGQSWQDDEKTINNNMRWAERNAKAIAIDENKISSRGRYMAAMKVQEKYGK